MAKPAVIVLGLAGVAVAGLIIANAVGTRVKKASSAPAAPAASPTNIEYVDAAEPLGVINYVNKAKGRSRDQALSDVVGKYTPPWDGTVTAITNESGGRVALRMSYTASTVIGGEYWVVALVGKDHGVKEGQNIRVQGKIKDVVFKTGPASVTQSVVLEDAKVVP